MRLITAFALSFFFTMVILALIFPAPPAKPKPSGRLGAIQTIQPVTNPFEFLPAPPSSLSAFTSPSGPYEAARQMMLRGHLREAQNQYLQILLARSWIDQKAMQGLARVQGLLAHGDSAALQQQADAYRHTIAQGSATGEPYTPRELELLAEASLLAAQQIQAEQAPRLMAVGSGVPAVSGIPQNTLRGPVPSTPGPTSLTPSPIAQQVVKLGAALNPASAGSDNPLETGQTSSSDRSVMIPIPASSGAPSGSSSGAGASGGGSGSGSGASSSWGSTVKEGTGSGRTGSGSSWGEGAPEPDKRPSGQ